MGKPSTYALKDLRSHTLKEPSSQPDTSRKGTRGFQDSTFTSVSWAFTVIMEDPNCRASQIWMVPSTEHDANT